MKIEDSTTYQLILNKGAAQGEARAAHRLVLLLGRKRFGAAPPPTEAALLAITDRDRLDRLAKRVLDATGWDDLLATP